MIKRIIFDVDNTLIEWKNKYLKALEETVILYNVNVDYHKINNLIEEYEKYYNKYTKNNLLNLINTKLNLDLNIDFIDTWLKKLESMADYNDDVYNTIKYLSNKYELVILSNWFINNQIKRLENAKLKDFFVDFIDSSNIIKPYKESFIKACGKNKIEECVMVGDNYNIDIKTPLEMGMKCIYINKNKEKENNNLFIIDNIKDIMNIL